MASSESEPKRYGPKTLSQTDADDGARLYIEPEAIEDSGLDPDDAVLLQPYENGIHIVSATEAVFDGE